MLLSDRDILAQINAGRVKLDPYDPDMIQPSSIDVRLDKFFRVFDNHKYAAIDPSAEQAELTRLVDVGPEGPFVLHPEEIETGAWAAPEEVTRKMAAQPEIYCPSFKLLWPMAARKLVE